MKVFILVIHLLNGTQAFDDTMDGSTCHAIAESLKEGGQLDLPGFGVLFVQTAECQEREQEPI